MKGSGIDSSISPAQEFESGMNSAATTSPDQRLHSATTSRYDEEIGEQDSSIAVKVHVWAIRAMTIYDFWTMPSSVLRAARKRCVDTGDELLNNW